MPGKEGRPSFLKKSSKKLLLPAQAQTPRSFRKHPTAANARKVKFFGPFFQKRTACFHASAASLVGIRRSKGGDRSDRMTACNAVGRWQGQRRMSVSNPDAVPAIRTRRPAASEPDTAQPKPRIRGTRPAIILQVAERPAARQETQSDDHQLRRTSPPRSAGSSHRSGLKNAGEGRETLFVRTKFPPPAPASMQWVRQAP